MRAKNHIGITKCVASLFTAASTLIASVALAGTPRAPTCLSIDGVPADPTACGCTLSPSVYNDEDGTLNDGTVIGDLTVTSATFHSIGLEWELEGDQNYNGEATVRYRKAGACHFKQGSSLIRNDYEWFWTTGTNTDGPINNFAGSLMFLTPGTEYEVVVELSDPDGGNAIRIENITTRAIPVKPTGGRSLYVIPGSGGGDGSSGNPFQGLDEADANAQAGDVMLLRDGIYDGVRLETGGAENNYIVYQEDPADPGATITSIGIVANHIWIDGLNFVFVDQVPGTPLIDQGYRNNSAIYVHPDASGIIEDIIVTNNTINGFVKGVFSARPVQRWAVMDNTIVGHYPADVGNNPPNQGSTAKGVGLGGENGQNTLRYVSPGNVIAFNSITRVADGINAAGDSDVYGNQVWDTGDDSVSTDNSYSNVRVWGNRLHYPGYYSISFQPQRLGPWYFLYNQFGHGGNAFKIQTLDRCVYINNTLVGQVGEANVLMRWFVRNNLFIKPNDVGQLWGGGAGSPPSGNLPQWTPEWNTDVDYDGFDGNGVRNPFAWDGQNYSSLDGWRSVVGGGVEANAIEVDAASIFFNYTLDPFVSLVLASGANAAVGAGAVVPNLSDFHGGTPDLGAHQRGETLPFGPRAGDELHQKQLYWDKH